VVLVPLIHARAAVQHGRQPLRAAQHSASKGTHKHDGKSHEHDNKSGKAEAAPGSCTESADCREHNPAETPLRKATLAPVLDTSAVLINEGHLVPGSISDKGQSIRHLQSELVTRWTWHLPIGRVHVVVLENWIEAMSLHVGLIHKVQAHDIAQLIPANTSINEA